MVEQRTHKPLVVSSNLTLGTALMDALFNGGSLRIFSLSITGRLCFSPSPHARDYDPGSPGSSDCTVFPSLPGAARIVRCFGFFEFSP